MTEVTTTPQASTTERHEPHSAWQGSVVAKAHTLYRQLADLEEWAKATGVPETVLVSMREPYYALLDELYQQEMPLSKVLDTSDIVVRLDGPSLATHTPKASLVQYVFQHVSQQMKTLTKVIAGFQAGRFPEEFDLGMTSIARGSLVIGFELPSLQNNDGGNLAESSHKAAQTLRAVLQATTDIADADTNFEKLKTIIPDSATRYAAMNAVANLAPSGKRGITTFALGGKLVNPVGFYTLTTENRKRVRKAIADETKEIPEAITLTGTVREIDLDSRRFNLRNIEGDAALNNVKCEYGAEFDNEASDLLDKKVEVQGIGKYGRMGELVLVDVRGVDVV